MDLILELEAFLPSLIKLRRDLHKNPELSGTEVLTPKRILAFFAQFIMKPADWGVLIPSIIFLTIGVGFSLHTFQYSFLGVRLFFNTYWPLLLILIGIIVILGGLKEKSKHKNNT